MGISRRPPEPEKVPPPAPARPSALELKVEELEEKGLIRILRGPGDAVSIEIIPVAVATPGGSDAPTPGLPSCSPSPGARELQAGAGNQGLEGEPGVRSGREESAEGGLVLGVAQVGAGRRAGRRNETT